MLNIQTIKIKDLEFEVVISEQDIQQKVRELAEKINQALQGSKSIVNRCFKWLICFFVLTYATKP